MSRNKAINSCPTAIKHEYTLSSAADERDAGICSIHDHTAERNPRNKFQSPVSMRDERTPLSQAGAWVVGEKATSTASPSFSTEEAGRMMIGNQQSQHTR